MWLASQDESVIFAQIATYFYECMLLQNSGVILEEESSYLSELRVEIPSDHLTIS